MNRPSAHRSSSSISPITPHIALRSDAPRAGWTKEPAHLPLHRRLLFPTLPLEQPLPAIIIASGSKRADLEVLNDRIYRLIALILRACVLSWYPRFSRDRTLLPTLSSQIIVPILSPILTAVYKSPDRIVQLLLIDIPSIASLHFTTYWQARQALAQTPHLFQTSDRPPPLISVGQPLQVGDIYHSRLPLLSVSPSAGTSPPPTPEGPYRLSIPTGQYTLSPLYLTSLTDALFRLHLPQKEYECTVERVMAREIVGRVVLGAVCSKLGEGWFWWSLGLKFMGVAPALKPKDAEGKEGMSKLVDTALNLFLRVYNGVLLFWTLAVSISARYTAAPPTEDRYRNCAQPWLSLAREVLGVDGRAGILPRRWGLKLAWGAIEGIVTLFCPLIDRILPHFIHSQLTPTLSLRIIDLLERLLFPLDGYPAPSPPDLTPEEAVVTRKAFESRLRQIIPRNIQSVLFPDQQDLGQILDPLDNPGCNAHLIAMLLDSIVGALEPELLIPLPTISDIEGDLDVI